MQRVVSQREWEPFVAPRRIERSAVSFGGCSLDFICQTLRSYQTIKHVWRVTIPSLMSPSLDLGALGLGNQAACDLLHRETKKTVLGKFKNQESKPLVNMKEYILLKRIKDSISLRQMRLGGFGSSTQPTKFIQFGHNKSREYFLARDPQKEYLPGRSWTAQ
jgi:hypothetical protein